jgi:DNA-binding NtrC family response regulator
VDAVYIVDDELLIVATLERLLTDAGYPVRTFNDAESAIVQMKREAPFLTLLDLQLPGMNGLEALSVIKRQHPRVEVVMVSGYGTIGMAVEAMKLGAADFLSKPLQLPEVLTRVNRIHETNVLRNKVDRLRERRREEFLASLHVSTSPAMVKLYRTARQVAQHMNTVALITGESGVGKEMLAQYIHYNSPASDGAFVPVHCAAIPETLIEAELFGYAPGAFTGASPEGKNGLVDKAAGGTLFLDEIGDLTPPVQVKLLRFLQDRVVTRVGESEGHAIECNIVAATHRDLEAMMRQGLFREDLFYRINVIRLHVPPLRERPEDIQPHAAAFLAAVSAHMGRQFRGFDEYAGRKLRAHAWPGNLRELRNAVERACLLAKGQIITPADLLTSAQEATGDLGEPLAKPMRLDLATNIYVRQVLESAKGNKSEAARVLGISRNRLKRLLTAT